MFPLRAQPITGCAGINNHAPLPDREFEAQRIRMSMPWQIIRTDWGNIQDGDSITILNTYVAGFFQPSDPVYRRCFTRAAEPV
ncbi:hypothetical protein FGKAn22_23270 [Ferrigenium kumadai]|uniref:Uncharacterized protein n=1 Tax=Ferrigenium kumadai TaxID=1682490 RepID=A0AAN1T2C4_9PROT|nr:hypothetical protein FGKAn22_23270 [Ferrigenium kumadai]